MTESKTNITEELRSHFQAIVSGKYDNFCLLSCFVNDEPGAAICAVSVSEEGEEFVIEPLFVSVTPSMRIVDHEGREAREENE
jgi:hypothetical protein